jgi:catechol 2,3-dioxygenase-like lactoylglutathione lyase family enzyme
MDPRISLITLGVSDLARSVSFYRDGLKLPYSSHSVGDVAFFELNGTWLGLYPKELLATDAHASLSNGRFSGITLAHNVRSTEEVDAVLHQAEAAGATISKPAEHTEWGGYSGYFQDPDGYYWEVAWNPHFWIG